LPPGPGETEDGDLDLVMQALLLPARTWRAAEIALLGVAVVAGGIVALSLFPDVDLVGLVIVPMAMALFAIPWAITVAVRWWRRYRAVRRTGWHRASAVRRTYWDQSAGDGVNSTPKINELISVKYAEGGMSELVAVMGTLPVGFYEPVWIGGERKAMVLLIPNGGKYGEPRPLAVRAWRPLFAENRPTGKRGRRARS
jgi:hypothetical protein